MEITVLDAAKLKSDLRAMMEEFVQEIRMETKLSGLPELLTIRQAAKLIGLTAYTIREKARTGQIKAIREGKSYLIPKSEIVKRMKGK